MVGRLRERFPEVAVGDLYAHPRVGALSAALEELGGTTARTDRKVFPIPRKTQGGQLAALVGLRALAAARWLSWLALGSTVAAQQLDYLPSYPVWVLILTTWFFLTPPGRMALAAGLARLVLRGIEPGAYPRGGKVHLRVWLAGRIQEELAGCRRRGSAVVHDVRPPPRRPDRQRHATCTRCRR